MPACATISAARASAEVLASTRFASSSVTLLCASASDAVSVSRSAVIAVTSPYNPAIVSVCSAIVLCASVSDACKAIKSLSSELILLCASSKSFLFANILFKWCQKLRLPILALMRDCLSTNQRGKPHCQHRGGLPQKI